MQSGSIRVYPLQPRDHSLTSMQAYWALNVHDNQYGHLRHVRCSLDDLFVLTAGDDGNIFCFCLLHPEELQKTLERKAKIPSPCIAFLSNGSMPSDLKEASVLNRTELHRLQQLKQQLEAEIIEQKDLLRQALLQWNRLVREAKDKVARIQDDEISQAGGSEALQILTGSKRLEELKQEKLLLEAAQAKEIRHWDVKIEETLEASTEAMKTNNELLYKLSTLYEEKKELELRLNARQKKWQSLERPTGKTVSGGHRMKETPEL
ncbi:hypothetical protein CRENBAI_013149, partial [Crenichthys baileyi]